MSQIQVDLSALPKLTNEVYYPLFANKDRFLVLYGGASSGKSVFASQKLVVRTMAEPGHRFLVVRKVARTLRNSAFQEIRETIGQWGLERIFKVNKSDLEISCVNGSKFIFAGLDDVEKLKSIARITSIWIEEASELTPQDFRQLNLRMRGKSKFYKQIILSFNPISALNWLKPEFFDIPKGNATILKTTYEDNRFIDDEDRKVLQDLEHEDYVYYQVYALGNWGVLGNLIFTNWTVEDFSQDERDYKEIYQGLDFGFNNPSAWIKVAIKDDELYILGEFEQKGLTNQQLISELDGKASKRHQLTADSAEPDRIKEFRDAGYRIRPCEKGKDSVSHGLDYLRRKKIHVHPSCTSTIKELQGYKYKEDKDGNVFDEPVKINDHLMDALRYSIDLIRGRGRPIKVSLGLNDSLSRTSPNVI